MYRVALRILGSREDAEDVVQEVFLATVRSHERLADVRDLTAYLFAAIHRAAGRCAMRRARAVPSSPVAADEAIAPPEPSESDSPDWHRLQQAVRSLPDEQREVVTLKIDGELTFAQIAEIVGVSISTAASRYQYALRKLRASLAGAQVLAGSEAVMENSQLSPLNLERIERLLACAVPRPEPSAGVAAAGARRRSRGTAAARARRLAVGVAPRTDAVELAVCRGLCGDAFWWH